VLRIDDVPDPLADDGWVVVQLRAAALNWHDCLLRQGQYAQYSLPRIPGSDGAGVRRDTGESVIILPSLGRGDDERAPGPGWQILGDQTDRTVAELVAVPESCVRPRPAGWSFGEAASLPWRASPRIGRCSRGAA
jgi:NADPH:quinone reductase-like Zn-dependent oxidoreductase